MKSIYNPDKNILEEQSGIKEPDITAYQKSIRGEWIWLSALSEDNYHRANKEYLEQKALCKTYPVSGTVPEYWLKGEVLEEGIDYRIDVEYENFEPGNRATRIVAVPMDPDKKFTKEHNGISN